MGEEIKKALEPIRQHKMQEITEGIRKMFNDTKTESIIIRVEKEMKDEIERLAKLDRRTPSDYLRLLIEDHIKSKQTVNN